MSKQPGKARFQIGVIVVAWAMLAPDTVPYWLVVAIIGAGAFLMTEGLWARREP